MERIEEQKALLKQIISMEWDNKKIWEHIRDKELSSTPAFKGTYYDSADTKLMFVGRALNGWEESLDDCSTIDKTVDSIFNQKDKLDTLICAEGFLGTNAKKRYYHKNQKFFRFIKGVLEAVGESEPDTDETWYNDSMHWNQKFVWANLYCVSKRSPTCMAEANPDNKMIKPSIESYVDLMHSYILEYQPKAVVFITDMGGWFVKWKTKKSFKDMLDEGSFVDLGREGFLVAEGRIDNSLILVCKRPDGKYSYTFDDVKKMAKEVAARIKGA